MTGPRLHLYLAGGLHDTEVGRGGRERGALSL